MTTIKLYACLYALIAKIDGEEAANEKRLRLIMCKILGFDTNEFDSLVLMNDHIESDRLYDLISKTLEKLSTEDQYRAMAWAGTIAIGDGVMMKQEWDTLYSLYHKHLGLSQQILLEKQSELRAQIQLIKAEEEKRKYDFI